MKSVSKSISNTLLRYNNVRVITTVPVSATQPQTTTTDYAAIAQGLTRGEISSHALEKVMGNNTEAVIMRRDFVANQLADAGMRPGSISGLPSTNEFDAEQFYDQVYGTNCESVVGFLPIPVGVVGPLNVNGTPYQVPLATTEGALIASANRGARALSQSLEGGVRAAVVRDGMTRSPVVKFPSAMRAVEFARWIEQPGTLDILQESFSTTTRFGKLTGVTPTVAGKLVFLRFKAATGDAMGMNMVGKGVNAVLEDLMVSFEDMKLVALSGNMCTDKKPSAINWVEGRGKSVVCEATLPKDVVEKVLKTTVSDLASLNVSKNLVGSSLAGSIGGNNAHASNLVTALYIATGQDPAQNVESSNCMTLLEASEDGEFLHASVTMPTVEVGTVGGGTSLRSQSACLEMLGVKGASKENAGDNARRLAEIVGATVLAGELSLNAALASGHLISAHMALNRKPASGGAVSESQASAQTQSRAGKPFVGLKKQTVSHYHETIGEGRRSSGTSRVHAHMGGINSGVFGDLSEENARAASDQDMNEPRLPIP